METVDYSRQALDTDMGVPEGIPSLVFNALCMCEEAGEIAGKIKKIYRDNHGCFNSADVRALLLEHGDLLWYLNRNAEELRNMMASFGPYEQINQGMSRYKASLNNPHHGLEIIGQMNINKLLDRANRGTLNGSGDYR